jgi:hypothetical protein
MYHMPIQNTDLARLENAIANYTHWQERWIAQSV